MRAIFKPDEPTKLIVRDADVNEVSLIQYFMNTVKSGGTLTADTRFDLNDKPAGILFTATAKPEGGRPGPGSTGESEEGALGPQMPEKPHRPGGDPEFSIYVPVYTDETMLGDTYKVKYMLDEEYEVITMDVRVYEELKQSLLPNFGKVSFSFEGNSFEIECTPNEGYEKVGITFQIPEGLLGIKDIETSKENYFTGTFTFVYPGDITSVDSSL